MCLRHPPGAVEHVAAAPIALLCAGARPLTLPAMYLGRVIGTCVATIKYEGLKGYRLLIVETVDDEGRVTGEAHVAVDVTQAGPGDTVFLVGSREAAQACEPSFVPVDAAVVGIVDAVDVPRDQP